MQAFLDSLREKTSSYRTESIKKVTEWRKTDQEYKDIKGTTVDPALKSFRKPERVHIVRKEETEIPSCRRLVVTRTVKSEIRTDTRKTPTRPETPFAVMNFKTEKWTAFRARAGNVSIGRSYPSAFTRRQMKQAKQKQHGDLVQTIP